MARSIDRQVIRATEIWRTVPGDRRSALESSFFAVPSRRDLSAPDTHTLCYDTMRTHIPRNKMMGNSGVHTSPVKRASHPNAEIIDSTDSPPSAKKACNSNTPVSRKRKVEQYDGHASPSKRASSNKKAKTSPYKEKRLRTFRSHAPQTFLQKLERARTQRMVVVSRTRSGQGETLQEQIDIVGTTGNIYTVIVGRVPECTCPDHRKGNECKHKVYALSTVLRAPYEYQYQRALLSTELEEIFANAPPIPNASTDGVEADKDGKRKPIEGECPICYMDFDEDNNELVWCRAGCGNNMHKECFSQWARSQGGKEVRCVYCRTPWQTDAGDTGAIIKSGEITEDGYVNVADQFGMSRARDYASYHQPWARRQFGYGW